MACAYIIQNYIMVNGKKSMTSRNGSHKCLWLKKIRKEKHTQQWVRNQEIAKKGKEMNIHERTEMISYHTSGQKWGMAI